MKLIKDSIHVIARLLGTDYLRRQIDSAGSGGFLMLDGDLDEDEDLATRILPSDRLVTLAWELHGAQFIEGFDVLAHELRRRSMYEAIAEMRAANDMRKRTDDLRFIDSNVRRGMSYGADMVYNGHRVAVEVKAKLSRPVVAYKPQAIVDSLSKARKQLPQRGPSLVYLQLASPWTDDPDTMLSVDRTIRHWLTNTGRVNGVLIMLERSLARPEGGITKTNGTAYIPNLNPSSPVPGLQD